MAVHNPFSTRPDSAPPSADNNRQPVRVEPPWQTLVLVCTKCKGARRGPDAREIRKGLKQRAGKHKQLRVLEVDCLSVCPDDAITVCISKTNGVSRVHIVQSHDELEGLAALI